VTGTSTDLTGHKALTNAHSAVAANTANRIVSRDGSGNFSAGTITSSLGAFASIDASGVVSARGQLRALGGSGNGLILGDTNVQIYRDSSNMVLRALGAHKLYNQAATDTYLEVDASGNIYAGTSAKKTTTTATGDFYAPGIISAGGELRALGGTGNGLILTDTNVQIYRDSNIMYLRALSGHQLWNQTANVISQRRWVRQHLRRFVVGKINSDGFGRTPRSRSYLGDQYIE